jgi:tetratricopeptide (TPR) repeat protein
MVMAELCSQQTRYADAETYYREVLKNNNGNVVAMNNLAVLLALQGIKLDESIRLANQAIEISGPLGIMLDSRASVYVAMKDLDKAFEDISKATAEDETPVRLFHKAQILDLMGRNDEAKEAFDKSLKKGLSPKMLLPLEMPAFEKLQQLLK